MSDNEKMLRNYEERVNDLGYTDLQYYIAEQIKNRHPKLDMYDLYMDGENNYMDYQACPIIAGELPLSRAMEKEATLQSEKELSDITPETWNIIVATAWREYGDENLPEKLSEMKDARKAMLVEQYKDNAFLDTFIKAYNAFDYSGTIPDVYAKKFFNIVDATVKTDSSLDRMFNQLDELATEIDEKDRPDFTKIWDNESATGNVEGQYMLINKMPENYDGSFDYGYFSLFTESNPDANIIYFENDNEWLKDISDRMTPTGEITMDAYTALIDEPPYIYLKSDVMDDIIERHSDIFDISHNERINVLADFDNGITTVADIWLCLVDKDDSSHIFVFPLDKETGEEAFNKLSQVLGKEAIEEARIANGIQQEER